MLTVGLYLRLSLVVDGEGAGLVRQQEDTERLAKHRGWSGQLYVDESVSAYNRRVKRPEFERLLADLKTGKIQGLCVWDIDRLARQPRDIERLIDLYEANPKLVFGTCQGDLNLATSDGRFMARILVSVANKSSADTGRRVARAHLQRAQLGIPISGSRPFGWRADKKQLDPFESELIRQAALDILAGKGTSTITREWNQAGITSPRGAVWSKQVVHRLMLSPRLAGFRVYRGEMALDASGSPVRGLHEPVLSVETWERVKAVLTDPARSGPHVHMGGRKYLLSGIIRCAICLHLMNGNANPRNKSFFYACHHNTCGKVSISGPRTDELITELVVGYLSERRVEPQAEPWPYEAELSSVTERIAELMTAYASGQLSGQVVFATVEQLEKQARGLRDDHSTWIRKQARSVPADVVEAWPGLALEQQRAVIQNLMQSIVVGPASRRGAQYDPDRVSVWKQRAPIARPSAAAQL
jgi:site-specific DNA recombinase